MWCMVVIWPGFLGEYVLSRNWWRRMERGNIGGVRGGEWEADQEAGVYYASCPAAGTFSACFWWVNICRNVGIRVLYFYNI